MGSSERETLRLKIERQQRLLEQRTLERDKALRLADDLRGEERELRIKLQTRLFPELALCREHLAAAARGTLSERQRSELEQAVLANGQSMAMVTRLVGAQSIQELTTFDLESMVTEVVHRLTETDGAKIPRIVVYSPPQPLNLHSNQQALDLALNDLFSWLLRNDAEECLTVDVFPAEENLRCLSITGDRPLPPSAQPVISRVRRSIEQLGGRLDLMRPADDLGVHFELRLPATIGVGSAPPGENEQLERYARDLRSVLVQRNEALTKVQQAELEGLLRLAAAAEHKDTDTGTHIIRMGHFSAIVADQLGMDPRFVEDIRYASRMHDVGKIGIPDNILKKPGKLAPDEMTIMRRHAEIGAALLSHSDSPIVQMAHQIALCHHERFDGSGYPRGLKGREIPVAARIVALTDYFDALTMDRCYRPAMPLAKVEQMIRENTGSHFDPEVVEAFFAALPRILETQASINRGEIESAAPGPETVRQ